MQYIFKILNIKIKAISPYNHDSLKNERYIKTIREMIAKQVTGTGQMWTYYLQTCAYTYNSFVNSALYGLSPFQLTFDRSLKAY